MMRRFSTFFSGKNLLEMTKTKVGGESVRFQHHSFGKRFVGVTWSEHNKIDLHVFKNTTFRNKLINEHFVSDVFKESGNVGFLEMPLKEFDNVPSKMTLGLLRRNDEECAYKREGLVFSDYAYPNEHEVIVVDYKNIPDKQKINLANSKHTKTGKLIGDIPAWAILMIITRDEDKLEFHVNPLYVDRSILSQKLKDQLDKLTTRFYRISHLARQDINNPVIVEFQESVRTFYLAYAVEAKLGTKQVNAIMDEMDRYKDVTGNILSA